MSMAMASISTPNHSFLSLLPTHCSPKPTNYQTLVPKSSQSQFHGLKLSSNLSSFSLHFSSKTQLISAKVNKGDVAPSFTLKDQEGKSVSLSKFKGKPVVVYFYPGDETPGCTKQACAFRDSYEKFKKAGAEVVGISGDDSSSHKVISENKYVNC